MSRRERKALKNLKAEHAAQEKFNAEQAKKAEKKAKQEQAKADWEAKSPEEKKQAYKIMAVVGVVVVVLFAILASCGGGDDAKDSAKDSTPTATAEQEAPTDNVSSADLGAEVESALLAANGVSSFTELSPTSPGWAITSIDEMNSSTVRVHVQESLSESEKKRTGSWTILMTCSEVPALDTVVVRDTSGIDTNVFKRNTTAHLLKDCG